jgi:hypothetical protein
MNQRIIAIVLFVIGIALVVLGVTHVLVGAAGGGGGLACAGVLLFVLSFIKRPIEEPEPPPLSPAARIGGIFYEPTRVFQNLRVHPRWAVAFLIMALVTAAYQVAFTKRIGAETIATVTIDKVIESGFIPAAQADRVREQAIEAAKAPGTKISGALNAGVVLFFVLCALSGLYMLGVLVTGGRIKFWQALAVATHAALPPTLLQYIISFIILFVRSPDEIDPIKGQRGLAHADLGLLFTPAEHPYLYVTGSVIGLFTIYSLWLTATGLHHGGDKVGKGAAWGTALALWFLGLLLALTATALFPSFVT